MQPTSVVIVLTGTGATSSSCAGATRSEKKLHFNTSYTFAADGRPARRCWSRSFGFDPDLYADYASSATPARRRRHVPFTGTARIPNLDYVSRSTLPNFKRSRLTRSLWGRDENFFEWASADIDVPLAECHWRPTPQLRVGQTYTCRRTAGAPMARSWGATRSRGSRSSTSSRAPMLRARGRRVQRPEGGRAAGRLADRVSRCSIQERADRDTGTSCAGRGPRMSCGRSCCSRFTRSGHGAVRRLRQHAHRGGGAAVPRATRVNDGFFVKASYLFRV